MEVVILAGLPGAGKSSFYRAFFQGTHAHVSKDLSRGARNREERQRQELAAHLATGRSVVVDNLNISVADRAPLIALARAHGATVIGYFFAVTTRQAVARNAERSGREKVPNVAIFTAAKRLQEPKLDEGFDQLFQISINDARQCEVQELATVPTI